MLCQSLGIVLTLASFQPSTPPLKPASTETVRTPVPVLHDPKPEPANVPQLPQPLVVKLDAPSPFPWIPVTSSILGAVIGVSGALWVAIRTTKTQLRLFQLGHRKDIEDKEVSLREQHIERLRVAYNDFAAVGFSYLNSCSQYILAELVANQTEGSEKETHDKFLDRALKAYESHQEVKRVWDRAVFAVLLLDTHPVRSKQVKIIRANLGSLLAREGNVTNDDIHREFALKIHAQYEVIDTFIASVSLDLNS